MPEALLSVCINTATSWSLLKLHFNWRSFFSSYCHLWKLRRLGLRSSELSDSQWQKEKWKCSLLSCIQLFVTPCIVACQAPLSMGFSRQENWSKLVAQWCVTLCNPMDCSLSGSSVHGILQARILEWVAIPFSRGTSRLRDWTQVSCIAGRFFTIWATREVHWSE